MLKFLKLIKNDKGATAIEYGLIAALIAVAAITAMSSLGTQLNTTLTNVSGAMAEARRAADKASPEKPASPANIRLARSGGETMFRRPICVWLTCASRRRPA